MAGENTSTISSQENVSDDAITPEDEVTPEEQQRRMSQAKKSGFSAFLGAALEYYDFFIYATAASLVFGDLFFPQATGPVALIASFATLGVAYIARPFGAVFFGHLGDKVSRKNILVATLVLMGGSTFLIGCLPTYDSAGVWAPIMLVVLRLMQGMSAGGEIAGASALTTEQSPVGLRGFFPSLSMSGISAGITLASLVFIPVAALDDEALHSWGWRIPFWLSIVVLAVAMIVRSHVEEPEDFSDAKESQKETEEATGEKETAPFWLMLKTHPAEFFQVCVMGLQAVTNTLVQAFGLAYGVSVGISATTMLWVTVVSNVVAIFSTPAFAFLSDKIGRKPTFIAGITGSAIMIWFYFLALESANVPLIFLCTTVLMAGTYAMSNSVYPAWFSELYNVKIRYSGMAVSLQVGIMLGGFTPMIASALAGEKEVEAVNELGEMEVMTVIAHWGPAAWIVVICSVLAFIGAITARETHKTPLKDLGNPVTEEEAEARKSAQ